MYKKIATVVDIYGEPRGVLDKVIHMAQKDQAELHLLIQKPEIEAIEEMNYMPYDSGMYMPYEYDLIKESDENYQKDVDKLISIINTEGLSKLVTTIFSGNPKSFVPKYIEKNPVNLVVLSDVTDLFSTRELEATAKHIIKETSSDLLVLR